MRLSSKIFITIIALIIALIIVLAIFAQSQQILGIDVIFVIILIILALVCAIVAFPVSGVYETFQMAKEKKETVIETEKREDFLMEQCFYHREKAISQCEKCARFICTECAMVFRYPFSGTLLVFTEDMEVSKHQYCPLCYWKSVHEIATSWSLRFSHIFALAILSIMLIGFNLTFIQPITALFSTPLNFADWILLGFLSVFVLFLIGMILLDVYSLFIDGPRRARKATVKRQEFLVETGIIEENLD